jgi:hypothetical protein
MRLASDLMFLSLEIAYEAKKISLGFTLGLDLWVFLEPVYSG